MNLKKWKFVQPRRPVLPEPGARRYAMFSRNAGAMMLVEASHGVKDQGLLKTLLLMIAKTHLADDQLTELSHELGRVPHQRLREAR